MTNSLLQIVVPALVAGVFGVFTALVTSRLTMAAERKRFDREMQKQKETWRREFAIRYAEAAAAENRELAERLRQQFAGAFLYIKDPELGVSDRRFIPNGAKMVLGADRNCDIVLPNVQRSVTRRHAMIEIVADEVWLEDLSSTTGTFVGDKPVTKRVRIKDGDTLLFGRCEALFKRLS